jgi:4-amino-4-deoxy-L-arabinose transferase-like glycosyltransferase
MFGQLLKGIQFMHAVLLILASVGFFIFAWRTRFRMPRYVHIMAFVAFLVGVGLWCFSSVPGASANRQGTSGSTLLVVLIFPAIVYFFFVFYGGQKLAFKKRFEHGAPAEANR